jgi:hypothetical protein
LHALHHQAKTPSYDSKRSFGELEREISSFAWLLTYRVYDHVPYRLPLKTRMSNFEDAEIRFQVLPSEQAETRQRPSHDGLAVRVEQEMWRQQLSFKMISLEST